ncbi:MAG: ComF family protein [Erysipelotrichaceae bacterium]|nr:ComF family protein [Erysipelotrichaceae bacterium]
MQARKQKALANLFEIFKPPIKICKICLKPIHNWNIYSFFHQSCSVCSICQNRLVPLFYKFSINQIPCLSIYKYDDNIKTFLYQVKACYDIELATIFLERFAKELHCKYHDFYLVPAPSFHDDDLKREFKHVEEIFRPLNLPFLPIVEKTAPYKQADHNKEQRKEINLYLKLNTNKKLYGKKILIVDDVFTTGSTVKAIIKLVKGLKPKKIEVLVMSKTFMN